MQRVDDTAIYYSGNSGSGAHPPVFIAVMRQPFATVSFPPLVSYTPVPHHGAWRIPVSRCPNHTPSSMREYMLYQVRNPSVYPPAAVLSAAWWCPRDAKRIKVRASTPLWSTTSPSVALLERFLGHHCCHVQDKVLPPRADPPLDSSTLASPELSAHLL